MVGLPPQRSHSRATIRRAGCAIPAATSSPTMATTPEPSGILRFDFMASPYRLQPDDADEDGEHGQWRAHLEIRPEADVHAVRPGSLHDDEVGDRADQREITGQHRCHRNGPSMTMKRPANITNSGQSISR